MMFFKVGKPVAAQKALIATEEYASEFNQPSHLLIQPCAAVTARQLMPERAEQIQENPMLVVHRLHANGLAKLCGNTFDSSPISIT